MVLQVVCLGAGMDTRPWRLDSDADIKWFDVDFAEVLDLKRRLLVQAGAQVCESMIQLLTLCLYMNIQGWTIRPADLKSVPVQLTLT